MNFLSDEIPHHPSFWRTKRLWNFAERSEVNWLSDPLIHPCDDWSEITQLLIININHQATDCWVPKKLDVSKKRGLDPSSPLVSMTTG